jgi:hypothetical protein
LPAMHMAEAANLAVAINIAIRPIATRAGVWTEVHHPKRPARRRKIEPPRLVRINQRIDVIRRSEFRGPTRRD